MDWMKEMIEMAEIPSPRNGVELAREVEEIDRMLEELRQNQDEFRMGP